MSTRRHAKLSTASVRVLAERTESRAVDPLVVGVIFDPVFKRGGC